MRTILRAQRAIAGALRGLPATQGGLGVVCVVVAADLRVGLWLALLVLGLFLLVGAATATGGRR